MKRQLQSGDVVMIKTGRNKGKYCVITNDHYAIYNNFAMVELLGNDDEWIDGRGDYARKGKFRSYNLNSLKFICSKEERERIIAQG